MKTYDALISLGLDCEVASKIKAFCGQLYPQIFNWAAQSEESLIHILDNGIDFLLSDSKPVSRNMFWYSAPWIAFHGRKPFNDLNGLSEDKRKMVIDCLSDEVILRHAHLYKCGYCPSSANPV